MNDPQKISVHSADEAEVTPCDIKSNLLIAKLLGQHSKEDHSPEIKEKNEKNISVEHLFPHSESSNVVNLEFNMWHSVGPILNDNTKHADSDDDSSHHTHSEHYTDSRVKMVYDLLSTLNTNNKEEITKIFLAMTRSPESCIVLRQSGCVPLLLQLIHGNGSTKLVRKQASLALHCIVQHNSEDKQGRRELRVFKLIEQILKYCENEDETEENSVPTEEISPTSAVATLMKLSFDEEYRHAMCQFGALHALAKLIQTDHDANKGEVTNLSQDSLNVRRYAGMALTNLTFGDSTNKALLCSLKPFMLALVAQLNSPNEDLCQVTAGVLRNLSWRADSFIKETLRDINAVTSLMKTALRVKKESTLKAVLSALWNLSAHSNYNKVDICNVDGAVEYLVKMLNYQAPSGTLVIVESVGGILRNISSLIAVEDDYRAIIRKYNCLYVLLHQLKSPSLTIVSNACGTLWNLTARCSEDQYTLCQLGAIPMLRSLIHSKHKMISVASTAALRNLLSSIPDSGVLDGNRSGTTLVMRKRRALEQEIDARLRETPENLGQLDVSPIGYDSITTIYSEHYNFSSKSGTVKSNELSPSAAGAAQHLSPSSEVDVKHSSATDDGLMMKNGNAAAAAVRFNLSLEESNKNKTNENRSTKSVPIAVKSSDVSKFKENGYYSNEDEELQSSKRSGFRKIEEPYNVDDSFGDYAETDLDQPTDYSLRFGEHGSDHRPEGELERSDVLGASAVTGDSPPDKKVPTAVENALETPLMFSRSSSLGTLSSCGEQVDDRSSVVSEFSRAVSGIVSPSELPDSPTETVPSSPHPLVKNEPFCNVFSEENKSKSKIPVPRCFFEDSVKVYKEESTPGQFSGVTSFSSLTFDDFNENRVRLKVGAPVAQETAKPGTFSKSGSNSNTSTVNTGSTLSAENSTSETYNIKDDSLDVELSVEEQQAMLQACIDSGKPSAQKSRKEFPTTVEDEHGDHRSIPPIGMSDSMVHYCTEDTPVLISHAASNSDLSLLCTPVLISHAASNSDLSLLCLSEDSFLQNSILPLSSCHDPVDMELSNDEQKKLLNFCIATGLQSFSNDSNESYNGRKSSQSSTLSEITEDLLTEDRTFIKDCTPESVNLLASSTTENEFSFAPEIANNELSEEEEKNLLNQCIALGMRSMKESSDLENIGPPSFLDEANLDSSLTNIEEITDYPPGKNQKGKCTPKQKRHHIKDRYNTYTVKLSPTKSPPNTIVENQKKSFNFKEKRSNEKDRFRTRTLCKGDFEEIAKCQQENKPPISPVSNYADDSYAVNSDLESPAEQGKAKIVKPVTRAKSGIPIVKSKLPTSKSTGNIKATNTAPELPAPLQRQNTFTKDEPSAIPVRKNSFKSNASSPPSETAPQFKSGIPSRIKEPSPRTSKGNDRSSDIAKNRWSVSDNNLSATNAVKATSNTSLNASSNYATTQAKVSPSASHSALPVRREYGNKNLSYGYRK